MCPKTIALAIIAGFFANSTIAATFFTGGQLPLGVGTATPDSAVSQHVQQNIQSWGLPILRIDNTGTQNGWALMTNSTNSGNANIAMAVGGSVKGVIGYDVGRGFLGILNSAYSFNDFAFRLNYDGSFSFHDAKNGTKVFNISNTGAVYSTEINVQATISDYVFDSNYDLPSLEDFQYHIKTFGHLPNVPSRADVEKNGGVPLGLLSTRTLEKVEELTLHIIAMNNRINDLQKENDELKASLQEIKESELRFGRNDDY